MDVLSDVLLNVRLSGGLMFFAEYRKPWCVACPPSGLIAPLLVPGARQLVVFHIVIDGGCVVATDDGGQIELSSGDAVMLAQGDQHVMGDALGEPAPLVELLPMPPWEKAPYLVHGGDGPLTRVLCGFLHCADARLSPFLASLPRLLRVDGGEGVSSSLLQVQRLLIEEARNERPGFSCVLSRLTETFFVEALRRHMAQAGEGSQALAALKDPIVGEALARIHAEPMRDWNVETLAAEVAASRSLLAQRFKALMGCAPMQYLTRWRLLTAARMLREGAGGISNVSAAVGYSSDAAFSRAFRRHFGAPPATWLSGAQARQDGA
jgi:AraC-like DNA-binding protein